MNDTEILITLFFLGLGGIVLFLLPAFLAISLINFIIDLIGKK